MASSGSDFGSTKPELSGLKNNNKMIISEYESAWSPTSPLDFKMFSSFVNPFGFGSSEKVGLSIVHSLDDHHHIDSSGSLDDDHIVFRPKTRSRNPKCHKPHLHKHMVDENISVKDDDESGIEISEDYTCVTSHGPNPKTTHFYGDRVLEDNGFKKLCYGNKKESIFVIAPLDVSTASDVLLPCDDFLSLCCSCNKKLDMGKDIYMYRGYKAFCSSECRSKETQLDDRVEEEEEAVISDSSSDKDMPMPMNSSMSR